MGVGIADGCIEGRLGQQTMPVALAEREFSYGRQQSREIGANDERGGTGSFDPSDRGTKQVHRKTLRHATSS